MTSPAHEVAALIQPRRSIMGISAILLPFLDDGAIDAGSFCSHVLRTANAGLTPAINMDTGYVNLLDSRTRVMLLDKTREIMGGRPFVAGAFVGDREGESFNRDAYLREIEAITVRGGIPVIFQSHGLTEQDDAAILDSYAALARHCDRFIGFELGTMFAPFGRIYSLGVYRGMMLMPQCIGAKHSSLRRELEWERLKLRNEIRPDFRVFTGNDLAIDMVMYGSDYLLGLSTFAPDKFAERDRYWERGDPAFFELNDLLQYLGFLAFRPPVPAYKHSAAMFLRLRGWIATDRTHPRSPTRPESDRDILRDIAERLCGSLQ